MSNFEWIKPEPTTTEDVYEAFRYAYDPEYRNPEAEDKWLQVNKEEFDTWLQGIKAEAWDEGLHALAAYQTGARRKASYPKNPYLTSTPPTPYAGGTANEGSFEGA